MNFDLIECLPDLLLAGLIYALLFMLSWKKKGKKAIVVSTIFYLYLVGVAWVTLMPFLPDMVGDIRDGNLGSSICTELFRDIKHHYGGAKEQLVLNVIMLVPLGFLIPFKRYILNEKKRGIIITVILAAFTSLCIETLQYLFGTRICDVTDLVTNTTGGLIGYILYLVVRLMTKLLTPNEESKNNNKYETSDESPVSHTNKSESE